MANASTTRAPFTSPLTPRERSFVRDRVARARGVHVKSGMKHVLDFEKEVVEAIDAFRRVEQQKAHDARLAAARRAAKREVTA